MFSSSTRTRRGGSYLRVYTIWIPVGISLIIWKGLAFSKMLNSRRGRWREKFGRGCMFFGPGHHFLDLYMFFGPGRIFLGTWGHKKCGGRACVFSGPCGDISFVTACPCAGPRECFLDSQITVYNCFWPRFLFFGPVHLLHGPCLHRVEGETSSL